MMMSILKGKEQAKTATMESVNNNQSVRDSSPRAEFQRVIAESDVAGFKRLVMTDGRKKKARLAEVLHLLHEIDETTKDHDTPLTWLCRANNVPMVSAIVEFLETNELLATIDSTKGGGR